MIQIRNPQLVQVEDDKKRRIQFTVVIQHGDGELWISGWRYFPESGAVQGPGRPARKSWIPISGAKGQTLHDIQLLARRMFKSVFAKEALKHGKLTEDQYAEWISSGTIQRDHASKQIDAGNTSE